MATPKFPLTMGDGAKVRTLEELREHADLYALEQSFQNGRLLRWLTDRGYQEQVERAETLQTDSAEFHQQLCSILGVGWDSTLTDAYQQRKDIYTQEKLAKEKCVLEEEDDISFAGMESASVRHKFSIENSSDVAKVKFMVQEMLKHLDSKIIELEKDAERYRTAVLDSSKTFQSANDNLPAHSPTRYINLVDDLYRKYGLENSMIRLLKEGLDKVAEEEGITPRVITPIPKDIPPQKDVVAEFLSVSQRELSKVIFEIKLYQDDDLADIFAANDTDDIVDGICAFLDSALCMDSVEQELKTLQLENSTFWKADDIFMRLLVLIKGKSDRDILFVNTVRQIEKVFNGLANDDIPLAVNEMSGLIKNARKSKWFRDFLIKIRPTINEKRLSDPYI